MNRFKKLRGNAGLSIIEALVAIGILGISSFAFLSVSANMSRTGVDGDLRRSVQVLSSVMSNRVQQPDICSATVDKTIPLDTTLIQAGNAVDGSPVRFDFGGGFVVADNTVLPDFGLKVVKSRLFASQLINNVGAFSYYHVRLGLQLQKIDGAGTQKRSMGSVDFVEKPVSDFIVKTQTATNQIVACAIEPDVAMCTDPACLCAQETPPKVYMPANPMAGTGGCVDPAHPTTILWQLKYPNSCKCAIPSVDGVLTCTDKNGVPHTPISDCGPVPPGYSLAGPNTFTCPPTLPCGGPTPLPSPTPVPTPTPTITPTPTPTPATCDCWQAKCPISTSYVSMAINTYPTMGVCNADWHDYCGVPVSCIHSHNCTDAANQGACSGAH